MDQIFALITGGSIIFTVLITCVSVACPLILVAAIFGGLFYYIRKSGQEATALNQVAQSWPSTIGQVITSRVQVSGGEYTSVTPHVVYTYQVNGMAFEGSNIKAGDVKIRVNSSNSAYDIVDRYPVGKEVTVYYNPANPAQSALER